VVFQTCARLLSWRIAACHAAASAAATSAAGVKPSLQTAAEDLRQLLPHLVPQRIAAGVQRQQLQQRHKQPSAVLESDSAATGRH